MKGLLSWVATIGARPPKLPFMKIFEERNWSLDLFVSFAIKRKRKENYLGRLYSIAKRPLKINTLKKMSWVNVSGSYSSQHETYFSQLTPY